MQEFSLDLVNFGVEKHDDLADSFSLLINRLIQENAQAQREKQAEIDRLQRLQALPPEAIAPETKTEDDTQLTSSEQAAAVARVAELTAEIGQLQGELTGKDQVLKNTVSELDQVKANHKVAIEACEKHVETIGTLKAEIETLKSKVSDPATLAELTRKLEAANSKANSAQQTADKSGNVIAKLEGTIEEQKQEIEARKAAQTRLESDVLVANGQRDDALRAMNKAKDALQTLQAEKAPAPAASAVPDPNAALVEENQRLREQYAILEPGKKTIVVWELYASYDVPKNYVFTCPLTLNSPMLETKRLDVRVDPRISKLPTLQATLEKLSLLPGERNSALFALPASRQNKNYYVITPDEVFQGRISSSSGNVQFQSSLPGAVPLYAAAQGGGAIGGVRAGFRPALRSFLHQLPASLHVITYGPVIVWTPLAAPASIFLSLLRVL